MKKIFLFALMLVALNSYSQKQKPITLGFTFDAPIERNMLFNGLSANIGAWFGNDNLVPIGLFVGYRVHQTKTGKIWQVFGVTTAWRIQAKSLLILPTFTYVSNEYQDLGIKFGYAIDAEKTSFVHVFVSGQMGVGIGTTISVSR